MNLVPQGRKRYDLHLTIYLPKLSFFFHKNKCIVIFSHLTTTKLGTCGEKVFQFFKYPHCLPLPLTISVSPTLTPWQAIVTALISFSTNLELKIIYLLPFRIPQAEGRQQCRLFQDGADSRTGLRTHSSGETSYARDNLEPFWSII